LLATRERAFSCLEVEAASEPKVLEVDFFFDIVTFVEEGFDESEFIEYKE
jgi:hypothetical protein